MANTYINNFQDFTTYTEARTDTWGYYATIPHRITGTNVSSNEYSGVFYIPYNNEMLFDFTFEFRITARTGDCAIDLLALQNNSNSHHLNVIYRNTNDVNSIILSFNGEDNEYQGDSWSGSEIQLNTTYYCTLHRDYEIDRLYIYSDAARTAHLKTLAITTDDDALVYELLFAVGINDQNVSAGDCVSFWFANLDLSPYKGVLGGGHFAFLNLQTTTGGTLAAGESTVCAVMNPAIDGGSVCGGTAVEGYSEIADGGAVCAGESVPDTTGHVMLIEVVVGGKAIIKDTKQTSGGAACGGTTLPKFSYAIKGGAVGGGVVTVYFVYGGKGGANAGGAAIVEASYSPTLADTYHNGYKYSRKITLNTTPTDFPVFVPISDLDPDHNFTGYDFDFEDNDRTALNWEWEDDKYAWIKTSNAINRFFYWKPGQTTGLESNLWDNFLAVYHLTTLDDSCGTNNGTGTSTDTTGHFHTSQAFDGSEYINLDPDSIEPTDDITVSGWIYLDGPITQKRIIYKRGRDDWSYELFVNHKGKVSVSIRCDGDPTTTLTTTDTTAISTGQWYHVAGVWESGVSLRLYVNGVLVGTSGGQNTTLVDTVSGSTIGQHWLGKIDELRISNDAKTAEWLLTEATITATVGDEEVASSSTCAGTGDETGSYNPTITGGTVSGGVARIEIVTSKTTTGGAVGAGSPSITYKGRIRPSGGLLGAGSKDAGTIYHPAHNGGTKAGGGHTKHWIRRPVTVGGSKGGGNSKPTTHYPNAITGGLRITGLVVPRVRMPMRSTGGAKSAGTLYPSYSSLPVVIGGARSGGRVVPSRLFTRTTTGGSKLGGNSKPTAVYGDSTTGGLILNGVSIPRVATIETTDGGLLYSGDAAMALIYTTGANGGATANGIANVSIAYFTLTLADYEPLNLPDYFILPLEGVTVPLLVVNYNPNTSGGTIAGGAAYLDRTLCYSFDAIPFFDGSVALGPVFDGDIAIGPVFDGSITIVSC